MKVYIGRPPGTKSKKKDQTVKVRIDYWDTWSMDHTLAPIILPMLQQLKRTNHGAPFTSDADVPDHLRSSNAKPKENEWDTDEFHFQRWDYIMDEMIFAFEAVLNDNHVESFTTSNPDYVPNDTGTNILGEYIYDWVGIKSVEDRMQNGFVLFGKYFQALWD